MGSLRPHNYQEVGYFKYHLYNNEKVAVPFYNPYSYAIRATYCRFGFQTNRSTGLCWGMTSNLNLYNAFYNGQLAIQWNSPYSFNPTWYNHSSFSESDFWFWNHSAFTIPAYSISYFIMHNYISGFDDHSHSNTQYLNTSNLGYGYIYQTKPYCPSNELVTCADSCRYRSMFNCVLNYTIDAYYIGMGNNFTIYVGDTHTMSATAYASDWSTALSRTISYSYGTPSVYNGGRGLKAGTCEVTASCKNDYNTIYASVIATVIDRGISLTVDKYSIYEGETVTGSISTTPYTDNFGFSCSKYGKVTWDGRTFTYTNSKEYTSNSQYVDTLQANNSVQTAITKSVNITIKPRTVTLTQRYSKMLPSGDQVITVNIPNGRYNDDTITYSIYKYDDTIQSYSIQIPVYNPTVNNELTIDLDDYHLVSTGTAGTGAEKNWNVGMYKVVVTLSNNNRMGVKRTGEIIFEVFGSAENPSIKGPLNKSTVYMYTPKILFNLNAIAGIFEGCELGLSVNVKNSVGNEYVIPRINTVINNLGKRVISSSSNYCPFELKGSQITGTEFNSNIPVGKPDDPNSLDPTECAVTLRPIKEIFQNVASNIYDTYIKSLDLSVCTITCTVWLQTLVSAGANVPEEMFTMFNFIPCETMFDWTNRYNDSCVNHTFVGTNPNTFKTGGTITAIDANAVLHKANETLIAYNQTAWTSPEILTNSPLNWEDVYNPLFGLRILQENFLNIYKVPLTTGYKIRGNKLYWWDTGTNTGGECTVKGKRLYFNDEVSESKYKPNNHSVQMYITSQLSDSVLLEIIKAMSIL